MTRRRHEQWDFGGLELLADRVKTPGAQSLGPSFAIIGDSITEFCSGDRSPPATNPIRIWRNDGYATWLRILSNQRVNLPVEHNYGVSGDRLDQILTRLDNVINREPQYCIVEGGTNDITQGRTFLEMTRSWLEIVKRLQDEGITPVITPIPPRGDSQTSTQILQQLRFNNFIAEHTYANRGFLFANWNKYLLDQTSATNAPLAGMMRADNIHPGISGGFWMGYALNEVLSTVLPIRETNMVHGPSDYYHATDNPTGNLLYTTTTSRGTMAGTGGTQTANAGLTYAGTGFAAGWSALRGTATSTCTQTLSKENPRTDTGRPSGERQIVQLAASSGGGADEVYNIRFTPSLNDIVEGDYFYGEASIEVTANPSNVRSLEFYLIENRPTNSQTSIENGSNDALSGFLPATTWSGVFRTPPIQRQADTTSITANIRARLNATSGAGITFKIGDMAVRKII